MRLWILSMCLAAAGCGDPLTVSTTSGAVQGELSGTLRIFRGIPYAAPPVGDLRWRPPMPHPGWSGTLDATHFGAECPQRDGGTVSGDEDCLTLNIWSHDDELVRPVMVWIHGGGFNEGSSREGVTEGSALALAGDVVVVSLNYRLGALGFLATEALSAESGDGSAGNYGIRDQILALEWIRANIARFGGDPEQLTIFGESAGGASVTALLGSTMADGLFQRAIIQSGGASYLVPSLRTSVIGRSSIASGEGIAALAGCTGAEQASCLRALSAEALVEAAWASPRGASGYPEIGVTIDGAVLREQPFDRIRDGRRADVPILVGSTSDESSISLMSAVIPDAAAYEALVRTNIAAFADDILTIYPASDFESPLVAWVSLTSDLLFTCPALSLANAASAGDEPAFLYHFAHHLGGAYGRLGAFHTLEIPYVFGTFEGNSLFAQLGYRTNEADRRVRDVMQAAWTSFAREGAPAMPAGWGNFDPGGATIGVIADPPTVEADIRGGRCWRLRSVGVVR